MNNAILKTFTPFLHSVSKRMRAIHFVPTAVIVISAALLLLSIKGQSGWPLHFQYDHDPATGGPFESSNSRSRYALVEELANHHSVFLSPASKLFAEPDVNKINNKYVSVFLPGISLLATPLYLIGKTFGMPELMTFLLNPLIAIGNMLLIIVLSRQFGAKRYASLLTAFLYLFATNALAYTQTLTQHQLTLSLVLLSLITITRKPNLKLNVLIGAVLGLSLLVDVPNLFILFPFAFVQILHNISARIGAQRMSLTIRRGIVGLMPGALPFLAVFLGYNYITTHSVFNVAQNMHYDSYSSPGSQAPSATLNSIYETKLAIDSRAMVQGLYILLLSDERGIFYYNAILLFGVIGLCIVTVKNKYDDISQSVLGSIVMTILLYAMFHDPWGGWSFGPRYLIPATGLIAVFIGPVVTKFKRNILFIILFALAVFYSTTVNVAGVLTTSNVPPKQEAEHLVTPIPYTYAYNFRLIDHHMSSSLVYNLLLKKYISPKIYFNLYSGSILIVSLGLYALAVWKEDTIYETRT